MIRDMLSNDANRRYVHDSHLHQSTGHNQATSLQAQATNHPSMSEESIREYISTLMDERLKSIEDIIDDVKRQFAMAINDAEDNAFMINKQMIDKLMAKTDNVEKDVARLSMEVKEQREQKEHREQREWKKLEQQVQELEVANEELSAQISRKLNSFQEKVKNEEEIRQSFMESIESKVEGKVSEMMRTTLESRLTSIEERLAEKLKTENGAKLSYFLSPFEENAMSGRSHPCPQKFEKKKVPTINLNSIVASDRQDQPRSRDLPPSKPDDSYTSFEEEFRFRLGKNRMNGKEEAQGVKLEDIKLSYVFSSNSKEGRDNLNLESEPLSRRLFEEDFKFTDREAINLKPVEQERPQMLRMPKESSKENFREPERDYSIRKQSSKQQAIISQVTKRGEQPNIAEEYSAILNNISNISSNSQAFMRQVVRQSGKKDNSSKKKAIAAVEEQSENKENINISNSIRVIQDDDYDEIEKWVRENDLHISDFQ